MAHKINHEDIIKKFESAKDFFKDDYTRNRDDMEFSLGNQWPEQIKSEREGEGRPCLTENRMQPFVMQVVNDIRQARPTVNVKPVDSGADVKTAEVLGGMIRNIQNVNEAETVYDTAAYNAVSAGYGWVRIGTKYTDYNSFDQEITMDRILNPFSVLMDPNTQKIDASDAEFIFVYDDMDIEEFKSKYPKASLTSFDKGQDTSEWRDENSIRVAEYFYKSYEKKELVEYELEIAGQVISGTGYKEEVPEGAEVIRKRDVDVCTIKHCKINGDEILEKTDFIGKYIPIVPVLGLEAWYEDRRHVYTLIHQAKDPQRMFNYWKTAATEVIALQPKAPYIIADGQVKGYEEQWSNANRTNHAFLPYTPMTKDGILAPPPQRVQPPTSSGSMMQEALSAADGIKASLGMQDSRFGDVGGNEISGKAIIARQMQGENSTFHFVDNLSAAMRHVGRILVDMIPLVYSGAQAVRILGEDGQEKMVHINQPVVKEGGDYRPATRMDASDQIESIMLDAGKYDIVVEVGPSYATKRQELANTIVELAKAYPPLMEIAGDMLVSNLDFPESDKLAKRIRSQMSPTLLDDDAEDARLQQMAQALGEVQETLKQTELALQVKQEDKQFDNQLELTKVQNETKKIEVEAMYKMAQIQKLQAETETAIPAEAMKDMSEAVKGLQERSEEMHEVLDIIITKDENGK